MLARVSGWLGLWLLLAVPLPALAQDVPPPLRDWQDWVLHEVPQHACPFLATQAPNAGSYQCAWPGRLTLDAGRDGGRFSLDVHVDAADWVALPGDSRHWPQQVVDNQRPVTVLDRGGQPMLWLEPGEHRLEGELPWSARPPRLRVPQAIGLVVLKLDGNAVDRVERNGEQLTLGEAADAQRAADALALRVYRRLDDGLPAILQTRLQLDVAGSAREQMLGPVLPEGFVATALSGDLPARLEGDGRLRVQVRPGQWTLTLIARGTAPLDKVALQLPAEPWPRQETWSYADDAGLRSTRVDGQPTDAAQAGVPGEWSDLPAFVLDDGHGLTIEQGARGEEGGKGDQLHLQRELWLDFDGAGFNVADRLSGELRRQQRLDVAAPWQLQRASQDGAPLLVSRSSDGRNGVELRERELDLDAGLRLPSRHGAMPSAGWQLPLESIDATLHLPHGYRLIGAAGADRSPDSWVGQWTLLDLFVVALVALIAGRLLGWRWALLAAAYLALGRHEHGAPLWTLAIALALALLLRALPAGRLSGVARGAALAVFALAVLWTLPFAATQLQYALHPQLEGGSRVAAVEAANRMAGMERRREARVAQPPPKVIIPSEPPRPPLQPAPPAPPAPPAAVSDTYEEASPEVALQSITVSGSRMKSLGSLSYDYDSRSVTQAGAGTPAWDQGNDYRLGWSGPVTAEQNTRLVIAPAWLVRLLRVLMVGLLALLLARLVPLLLKPLRHWRGGRLVPTAGAVLLVVALLPSAGRAQSLPDTDLLDQLRDRLTEAPECAPGCATVAQARISAIDDRLVVQMETHAGATVALPLPQADAAMALVGVELDGRADPALGRRGEQLLLRLERGVHRVALSYRLGHADNASLRFALRPQQVVFDGQGWSPDGIDDGRLLGDSLALHRVRTGSDGADLPTHQDFPPYVRLTRTLQLGVDWTVQNTVERMAPSEGGFSVSLPLLPGEHPLGDGALVKDGRIAVTFTANSHAVTWESRLDHVDELALQAPALGERADVWMIDAAPMWHVDASGVPASASDYGLRYQPLPGETLSLAFSRPEAAAGDSLAFDKVDVRSRIGGRVVETRLELQARSTRGGEHAISLPAGAELLDAMRDGEPVNLAVRDGKLGLPLLPGEHDYTLSLREPRSIGMDTRSPVLALDAPVANIGLDMELPQDRWILWAWGPAAGPAVLYWSQLVVLLLAAWLLARYAPTPLKFRHWLLLGLGFSAFAWSAYALVVLWLILLGLRGRRTPLAGTVAFNLAQIGLVALTALALAVLVAAIPGGLLGQPDMHVAGNGSYGSSLRWFADQSTGALPVAGVFSVSLWFYKLAMLAWALWLAWSLIGWLRWAFEAWTRGGYWRKLAPKPAAAVPPLPQEPKQDE